MTSAPGWRDRDEIDAMTTDRYLDALLSAHAAGATRVPASSTTDPLARSAADRLSRDLPRLHPSFRFEEGLWLRLADVARGARPGAVASPDAVPPATIHELSVYVGGPDRPGEPAIAVRPLLVGGALTSAALSIAGAAYVAWRLSHPTAAPMARAVRAVTRARLA